MIAVFIILFLVVSYFNKKNKVFLFLFFFVLTNGFQIIPSTIWFYGFPFLDKPIDILWISSITIIALDLKRVFQKLVIANIRQYLGLLVIMCIAGSFAAFTYGVQFSDQLRVLRNELLPFVVLPLLGNTLDDYKYLFRLLFTITILQSVLFLLQLLTGHVLLFSPYAGTEVLFGEDESTGLTRFYNMPVYLILFFYYSLLELREKTTWSKLSVFILLSLAVIAPLHRGMLISILASLVLFNILFHFSIKTVVFLICILFAIGMTISFVPGLNEKFISAWEDIQALQSVPFAMISDHDSTFAFRVMHLLERIQYISENPARLFFGIGLMPEDIKAAKDLPLLIGNYKEELGGIKKIETSDIAWSSLLLRFGLLGLFVFATFIKSFFKEAYIFKNDKIIKALLLYVVAAILGSFTGAELTGFHLRIIVLVSMSIYIANIKINENINYNTNL